MVYIELKLVVKPLAPYNDIVMGELGDIGYESFVDTEDGLSAYIQKSLFDEAKLQEALHMISGCTVDYSFCEIPDQDWNAVWESTHEPVLVENFCWIYAPFHKPNDGVKYNIVIEPKMSFGTAHHATTYLMLCFLEKEPIEGKQVLDMGSGTGVLAILAEMRGASYVEAIDNDEWAYRNALENVSTNQCRNIHVFLGNASLLTPNKRFDIVIANINRNILLTDMKSYINVLNSGGTLLLSGFYEHDIPVIRAEAERCGMKFDCYKERDEWVVCRFIKMTEK